MRWGVGKGRFRNVTAIFLCVLLTIVFSIVWAFFQRIKPLTIDTSARAHSASVEERLINNRAFTVDSTTRITDSQVTIFLRIADSLNSYLDIQWKSLISKSPKSQQLDSTYLLGELQEYTRKQLGALLNDHYISIQEYRYIENTILANALEDTVFGEFSRVKNNSGWSIFLETFRVSVQGKKTFFFSLEQIIPLQEDKSIISNYYHKLKPHLQPFIYGLTSDKISYVIQQNSNAPQEKTTLPQK